MHPLRALTSFLALTLAPSVLASPLEELAERATPSRVCNDNVAKQISSCATRTAFCSRFLSTYPPVATRTSTTKVTVSSVTRTTATVTVATSTTTSDVVVQDCTIFSKREAAPSAAAAGPSCSVGGKPPAQIENGCSCQKSFTFKGSRPKPTTTTTIVVTNTVHSVSTSTSTTSVTATHTATSFKLFRDFGGTSNGQRLEIYYSSTDFTSTRNGTIFTQDPQNIQLWAAQLEPNGPFYTIFGQQTDQYVAPMAINSTSPNSPPNQYDMLPYPWVPLSIGFDTRFQCAETVISFPDGTRAYPYQCEGPNGQSFVGISTSGSQQVCTLTGFDVQNPKRSIPSKRLT